MTEKLTYEQLEEHIERLERRLKHLLQSKTIQLFDEVDPRTGDYKRNIKRLDTYGVHYKVMEYERTGKVPRTPTVVKLHARDLNQSAKVLERMTKAINDGVKALQAAYSQIEQLPVLEPEVLEP